MRRCLPLLVLVGCSSEAGVGWRLPCAGQRFDDGATIASALYQYEWDDDGHLLREARTEDYGGIFSLTQEWEDGVIVLAEYQDGANTYGTIATQSGGRIQTREVETWSGVMFEESWTWTGDGLDRVDRRYLGDGGWEEVDTYEDTPDGFMVTTCEITDPRPCDRRTVVGAAHRGDFSRWTRYELDRGDDGLDQHVERELDPHELVLVEDHFDWEGGGPALAARIVHLREADGTALSESFERFGVVPSRYVLEFDFECSSDPAP